MVESIGGTNRGWAGGDGLDELDVDLDMVAGE
jgi:hypothetical protein